MKLLLGLFLLVGATSVHGQDILPVSESSPSFTMVEQALDEGRYAAAADYLDLLTHLDAEPTDAVGAAATFPPRAVIGQIDSRGTLEGQIISADTRLPLPGVNVFLNNTTFGSATDENGYYQISDISMGTYEVIASMIGYRVEVKRVQILEARAHSVNITLSPVAYQMSELYVLGKEPVEWKKDLEKFKRLFLGQDDIADKCKIMNPEVLDFQSDNDVFSAEATEPIKIINPHLGFQLTFLLEHFEVVSDTINYRGKTFFETLKPSTRRQEKRWEKNRKSAYIGSFHHFIDALLSNRIKENHFSIYGDPHGKATLHGAMVTTQYEQPLLFPGRNPQEKILEFNGEIQIIYFTNEGRKQISWIKLLQAPVYIDTNGWLINPNDLLILGYWSRYRIAHLLPWNYPSINNHIREGK